MPLLNRKGKSLVATLNSIGSGLLLLAAVFLLPWVFQCFFAVARLTYSEEKGLLLTSACLVIAAGFLFFRRRKSPGGPALAGVTIIGILFFELAFRLFLNVIPTQKNKASDLALRFERTSMKYVAHPFLGYIGDPKYLAEKDGERVKVFNSLGFQGSDFSLRKKKGVIRGAALGGSTTAYGYPLLLENHLNKKMGQKRFEIFNFAHEFYNSVHNLINLQLNILDFKPDFLLIHMGWNDSVAKRPVIDSFRSDYSHVVKPLSPPSKWKTLPLKLSAVLRHMVFSEGKQPNWFYLDYHLLFPKTESAAEKKSVRIEKYRMTFARNLRLIVEAALARDIEVFFVPIPYSTDKNSDFSNEVNSLIEGNQIVNSVVSEYDKSVHLIEEVERMTGENQFFIDLAHLNEEGRAEKARLIAPKILRHFAE